MIPAQLAPPTLPSVLVEAFRYAVLVAGYLFLLATSGRVVEWVLSTIEDPPQAAPDGGDPAEAGADIDSANADADRGEDADRAPTAAGETARVAAGPSQADRDVGRIIGKCENVLVVTFVVANAFTALALVFGAKSIVRREDMQNNSKYYLAGTLVNFTYSLLVGGVLRLVV